MIVSDYIFDFLQRKGVDTAFMVSGGQAMFLVDSLGRHPAIKTICTHHEQSAGMSADAYARLTGKLGVALVTAGPGSVNIVNGLVGGWTDSAPMMVISGQSALSCVNYQAKSGIRQYGIQGIYIQPFVEKATKFFVTVDDPAKIQYYMEKAYYLATSGRPGPVWIDVPLDVQRMEVPEKLLSPYHPEASAVTPAFTHEKLLKTWELLKKAKRPLIIAGQGVRIAQAALELRNLLETLKIPLITTRLGIDLIESGHPLYVGRPGNYGERAANFAVQNADFILAVGSRLSTASVGHDSTSFGKHAVKVMVDIDLKELDKPGVPIDLKINGDAKEFIVSLLALADAGQMQDTSSWVSLCNGWKRDYPVVLPSYKEEKPVNSYYFTERLCEKTGSDDVVLVDTGSCFHVACQVWKVKKGQRFLTTGGLSSMGYWVAGIGACAANHYRRTLVITGDGSLQMNLQELATIKHHNLPIKIIIFNNNGYLLIRQTQRNFMEGRLFGEGPESGVWCPDSLKIAEAYGIKGVRIDSVADLDAKIDEVLAHDGPVVCDVMTPEWQLLIPRVSSEKLPDGKLVSRKYEDMFPYLPEAELKRNMVSEQTP
ncbi:MAG: thiamine pyrophosphate-binding protein [bacterium]